MKNNAFDADEDVTWCDLQTNCYECQFFMDDCDGKEEKMDERDFSDQPDKRG